MGDLKIVGQTIKSVVRKECVTMKGMEIAMDFGDAQLSKGHVSIEECDKKQVEAWKLIGENEVCSIAG